MEESNTKENPPAEVKILKDGPILIKGTFLFRDSSGNITQGEQELYLCRCGASSNKPWCDGTHKKVGVVN
jgi:CDGSH-type Zn-finger protein